MIGHVHAFKNIHFAALKRILSVISIFKKNTFTHANIFTQHTCRLIHFLDLYGVRKDFFSEGYSRKICRPSGRQNILSPSLLNFLYISRLLIFLYISRRPSRNIITLSIYSCRIFFLNLSACGENWWQALEVPAHVSTVFNISATFQCTCSIAE